MGAAGGCFDLGDAARHATTAPQVVWSGSLPLRGLLVGCGWAEVCAMGSASGPDMTQQWPRACGSSTCRGVSTLLTVRGNASQEKSQSVSPSGYVSSAYRRTINLLAWLLACPDVGDMYSEAGGCAAGAVCSGRHLRSTARGVRGSIGEGQCVPTYQHRFLDSAGAELIVFPTAHQARIK